MMRILVISKSFPPHQSARSIQIGKVVDAISRRADVQVVAGLPENTKATSNNNIHYVNYPNNQEINNVLFRICRRVTTEFETTNYFGSWVRNAFKIAIKVVCDFMPEVVMTSSTPFESHLVGVFLKKKTQVPWIASFSDPWPSAYMPYPYSTQTVPILSEYQKYMMKKVIYECNAIHMPNKYAIELIGAKTGIDISKKSYAVPHISNSIFPSENANLDLSNKLVHIGHLSRERVSMELLKAVKEMEDKHKDIFDGMVCIGTVCPEFKSLVSELQMEKYISILGQVPPTLAMEYAVNSHVLLLIEADMSKSPFLPSKFVDYVATDRPILALTPPISPIRSYLNRQSRSIAVVHDSKTIFDALCVLFAPTKYNPAESRTDLAQEFQPDNVAKQYLDMFNRVS